MWQTREQSDEQLSPARNEDLDNTQAIGYNMWAGWEWRQSQRLNDEQLLANDRSHHGFRH